MANEEMQTPDTKGKPTQDLINLSQIRDGIVVMNDGTMRAIVMVSSVNFALKSEDEQNAIIYAYQDFLNSLDFPIQITITSRNMDIQPYLEQVRQLRDQQENELLQLQMNEYINFIGELVKDSNIMTKTFYVTIPYSVTQNEEKGFFSRIMSGLQGTTGSVSVSDAEFESNKVQLFQRVEQVAAGLQSIGLRVLPLQTREIIELFYESYNPNTARNQRLQNIGQLNVQETNPKDKST